MCKPPPPGFAVTRNNLPISDVPLLDAVNPGIQYSMEYVWWEAGAAAGLDMWRWYIGGYPKWFMAKAIAWHQKHGEVEAHRQDALNRVQKQRSRGGRRGYRR